MLDKLSFELTTYHQLAAFNSVERTYCAINCASTAWHLKDWVWTEVKARGINTKLDEYFGRRILGSKDFGTALGERYQQLDMCRHIATATKHVTITESPNPTIRTLVERDAFIDELWVSYSDWQMPVIDVLSIACWAWTEILRELGMAEDEPFAPNGDANVGSQPWKRSL